LNASGPGPDPRLAVPPDRHQALFTAKLRALVRARWSTDDGVDGPFPGGATLRAGDTGWVLVGEDGARRLGGAMAWARQQRVVDLHLLADDPTAAGILARRAALFVRPPTVWRVDGRMVSLAPPSPPARFAVLPPTAELFRPLLLAAGLEVQVEQGELLAEVNGLEVARVVSAVEDGSDARLEVGVGRFDREAFAMMNAGLPDAEALAKAAQIVRDIRRPDAPRHQLNQLAPERWRRAAVVADPSLVGAATLVPVESALPRPNLKASAPATAVGTDLDGQPLVVVCSSGVDLDLVPSAADDRLAHAPAARLLLALPARDVLPVTEAFAAALVDPAEIVTVEAGWTQPARPA